MSKKIYKEEQSFTGYEAIVLLGLIMAAFLYLFAKEVMHPNDDYYIGEILYASISTATGFGIYYLLKLRLKTKLSEKKITFQMKPWHSKKQKIKLDNVEDCEIIRTSLLSQWQGGNISFGKESMYSLSGRNGMSITTKDGQQYFIGSKNLTELEHAIKEALKQA